MNRSKAEAIVARLLTNAADLKYGSVSVTAKVHDGRVVEVQYATTECTRDEREKSDTVLKSARQATQKRTEQAGDHNGRQ